MSKTTLQAVPVYQDGRDVPYVPPVRQQAPGLHIVYRDDGRTYDAMVIGDDGSETVLDAAWIEMAWVRYGANMDAMKVSR